MKDHLTNRRAISAAVVALTVAALVVPLAAAAEPAATDTPLRAATHEEGHIRLLDATPESATVVVPTDPLLELPDHTITVAAVTADGQPDAGRTVTFDVVDDPADTSSYAGGHAPGTIASCETGEDGTCSVLVPGGPEGKDRIRASFGDAAATEPEPEPDPLPLPLPPTTSGVAATTHDAPLDHVTVTWVPDDDEGEGARLGGIDRFATAVAISQELYPDEGSADAVVIARSDLFPDSLTGTPFATSVNAPILLTQPETLNPTTTTELERVLEPGGTVYILGGTEAVSQQVEFSIQLLGFETDRIGGATRMETAIEIAQRLGDPSQLLVTAGHKWPDAVVAGAAAAAAGDAAILLAGFGPDTRHPATEAYLEGRTDGPTVLAVGGPAVNPYVDDERVSQAIWGQNRFETGVAVAEYFFDDVSDTGFARSGGTGTDSDPFFADSLTGGVHVGGRLQAPMLLTPTEELAPAAARFVCHQADVLARVYAYGGPLAVSDETLDDAVLASRGTDCVPFDAEPDWVPHGG